MGNAVGAMLGVGASTTDGAVGSGALGADTAVGADASVGAATGALSEAHAVVALASKALHASQTAAIAQNRRLSISLSKPLSNAD